MPKFERKIKRRAAKEQRRRSSATYTSEDREAYHEAGHAVACVLTGHPFERVSLEKRSERVVLEDGRQMIAKYTDGIANIPEIEAVRQKEREQGIIDLRALIVAAAGMAAEALAAPKETPDLAETIRSAGADFLHFEICLRPAFPESKARLRLVDRIAIAALRRAAPLLEKAWPAVVAVAQALRNRGALDYDEAERLIREAEHADIEPDHYRLLAHQIAEIVGPDSGLRISVPSAVLPRAVQ